MIGAKRYAIVKGRLAVKRKSPPAGIAVRLKRRCQIANQRAVWSDLDASDLQRFAEFGEGLADRLEAYATDSGSE